MPAERIRPRSELEIADAAFFQPHVQFRRAVSSDAEDMLSLWKSAEAVHGLTDTVEDVQRVIKRENAAFILATSHGDIAGSIIAAFDGWRGNIYRLAVHPHFRRRGLARALVVEAEKVFKEWGVKRIAAIVVKEHLGQWVSGKRPDIPWTNGWSDTFVILENEIQLPVVITFHFWLFTPLAA